MQEQRVASEQQEGMATHTWLPAHRIPCAPAGEAKNNVRNLVSSVTCQIQPAYAAAFIRCQLIPDGATPARRRSRRPARSLHFSSATVVPDVHP